MDEKILFQAAEHIAENGDLSGGLVEVSIGDYDIVGYIDSYEYCRGDRYTPPCLNIYSIVIQSVTYFSPDGEVIQMLEKPIKI